MTVGRSSTWSSRKLRAQVLDEEPVCRCKGCAECTDEGCTRVSTDDDHIIPLSRGGSDARSNHRGMCHQCHDLKSRLEGAEANRRKSPKRPREKHPGLT